MDYDPEHQPPHAVQLGQLGRRVVQGGGDDEPFGSAGTAPAAPLIDTAYYPRTRHKLGGRFLQHWLANDGLA